MIAVKKKLAICSYISFSLELTDSLDDPLSLSEEEEESSSEEEELDDSGAVGFSAD